ncbi:hypothetical protein [Paenibacillus sp. MBLB4367]|uniref:hypothetical protein n=1 Tax=Paenibacillus sp. MBLB4367 TaxID=3384767 RepID=UPI0039082304
MIRMKVKTLAIGSVALVLLLIAVYSVLPSVLMRMKQYDSVLTFFSGSKEAPDALYWAAETAVPNPQEEGRVFIFPGSVNVSGDGLHTREQLDYAEKMLIRLIEKYPGYRHIDMARSKLAQIYLAEKKPDSAERLFQLLAASAKDDYKRKEAKAYADLLASRRLDDRGTPSVSGTLYIGNRPAADAYAVLRRKSDNGWYSSPYGHYPMAMTNGDGVFRFNDVPPGEYEIGIGVTDREVDGYFLTEQGAAASSVVVTAGKTVSVDMRFVPKVGVSSPMNHETVSGKDGDRIRFAWEPYPGAANYKVSLTALERDKEGKTHGTFTVRLDETWKEPWAEYAIDTLRTYPRGVGKSGTADKVWLASSGILGAVYPGGDFIWSVDAFDTEGRRISSSSGYYFSFASEVPFFSIDDAQQLKGDKLVLEGDYPGAIQAYEGEQDNPYALRALALLWMNGWTFEDKGDKAKALAYLQKIAAPAKFDYELMQTIYESLGNAKEAERIRGKRKGL